MSVVQDPSTPSVAHLAVHVDDNGDEDGSLSLLGLATAILRYRRWVFGAALACAVLVGVLTVLKARK